MNKQEGNPVTNFLKGLLKSAAEKQSEPEQINAQSAAHLPYPELSEIWHANSPVWRVPGQEGPDRFLPENIRFLFDIEQSRNEKNDSLDRIVLCESGKVSAKGERTFHIAHIVDYDEPHRREVLAVSMHVWITAPEDAPLDVIAKAAAAFLLTGWRHPHDNWKQESVWLKHYRKMGNFCIKCETTQTHYTEWYTRERWLFTVRPDTYRTVEWQEERGHIQITYRDEVYLPVPPDTPPERLVQMVDAEYAKKRKPEQK